MLGVDKVLSEVQRFLLFMTREKKVKPNPLLFILSVVATVLYAFYAPPLPYSLALIVASLIAIRRDALRLISAIGAVSLFTATIYGIGFVLMGKLPAEFLPTLLRAVDSTTLLFTAIIARGAVSTLLSGACIAGVFNELLSVVKTASLAPNILREALIAYAVYNNGRVDMQGVSFAAVYFLQQSERLYRSVTLALSMMGRPQCRAYLEPLLLMYMAAVGVWVWLYL